MKLRNLVKDLNLLDIEDINVNEIKTNSKLVKKNDLFIAINGSKYNGHDYIDEAIKNGASVVIFEEKIEKNLKCNYIMVDNTRIALALISKRYYKDITKKVKLIGVTGTNGKTTISTLLFNFLEYSGKKCLLIGTNGIMYNNLNYDSINTTPDILESYEYIYEAYKKGVRYVIMEVSSQAIDMLRVYGFDFNIAVFTNLTHEHLDYHKTMERYENTKGIFLQSIKKRKGNFVVLNKDDNTYKNYIKRINNKIYTYGINNNSDYTAININKNLEKGTSFRLIHNYEKQTFRTNLIGEFNIYNILATTTVVNNLGYDLEDFKRFLRFYVTISGRMEMLKIANRLFIIDYAHTPDGVSNVLNSIKEYNKSKLIVVIGCGGNRDHLKRPLIGNITTHLSDFVIFTSDNPRNENTLSIINDILEGVSKDNYLVIENRYDAIKKAIEISNENDCIAILGKGNENSQIINNIKYPFNDKEVVKKIMKDK